MCNWQQLSIVNYLTVVKYEFEKNEEITLEQ